MIEEKKQQEIKEISMEELKGLLSDSVKELLPELKTQIVDELKPSLVTEGTKEATKEEKMEVAKKFLVDLVEGKLERKDNAIGSGTASFGYTIPTELASAILEKKDKIAKMRKVAFTFNLAGPFQLPTEGTGVTAYWVTESEEIDESTPTIGKKDLVDYYLAARVLMPRQLLNTSAYNVVEYVSRLMSRAISRQEESSFIVGSGSGQPTGFRGMTGHNVDAQDGATLAYNDMVDVFYGLKEQYRQGAIWMTSAMGMKAIRKIKDSNGIPIFNVNDSTVFSRPVIESEDIPANLGTSANETELWLFDPSYYWIKDGDNMFMDTDKIIKTLQIELVAAEAIDGVYTLPAAAFQLQAVK
jgi:HK97 family phage major capsid protein